MKDAIKKETDKSDRRTMINPAQGGDGTNDLNTDGEGNQMIRMKCFHFQPKFAIQTDRLKD